MKTKLKKVVPSASCLVLSAKKMLAVALCAVGLAAFAEESVTINEVKSVQPWDKAKGTITVDYSLGGLDAATDYKVAFDITAGGQIASVTNDATKLTDGAATKEIDTAKLFGKQVVDTKAQVKVSLIAIKPKGPPAGALKGEFSVSATNKVRFSKGNLWYDGSAFKFETNQYDFQSSWSTSHVSHFYWSKTASVAYDNTYSDGSAADSDVFFANSTTETAKSDFTVNGVTGKYRTLSKDEWKYLFDTRTVNGGTKEGKSYQRATINSDATSVYGLILYPDNYTSQTDATSYTSTEWTTMEENGCVFLPAAGYRGTSSFFSVGSVGYYWSSTAQNGTGAYYANFTSSYVRPTNGNRKYGYSVRLVTEVK